MINDQDDATGAASATPDGARPRIIAAASKLLAREGRDAPTIRAIAAAAGVQAPTIYRLFGDKVGVLDAVAEHGFATYLRSKEVRPSGPDPVEDLRAGWDLHIGFGLANPTLYALMYGDPRPGVTSTAAEAGYRRLKELVHRIAAVGRLRVSEERAAALVHASGCGTVLTLLAMPEDRRDPGFSEIAREAAIAAIATGPRPTRSNPATAAITLRAVLGDATTTTLTGGERRLLEEWLGRLAEAGCP